MTAAPPSEALDALPDLESRLGRWAEAKLGPGSRVTRLKPMPGNAGLSFGFDVEDERGDVLAALVMRLAPPGVGRRGNTDVLRQVPLLHALRDAGVPVAEMLWSTDDPAWFGTDVIVQRRLPAKPLHMYVPSESVRPIDGSTDPYLRRAVEALVGLHRLDWRETLPDWETERSVADEVQFWRRLFDKSPERAWLGLADELATGLLASDPGNHRIGIFHGDFQTNNILFDPDDGSLVAIVDWELSGIGPTGFDLGWLSMMTDPSCFAPERDDAMHVRADPDDLVRWYEEAAGWEATAFGWYKALACFRFASIIAFNLRLHRSGRRVDSTYERMVTSIPALLESGLRLFDC